MQKDLHRRLWAKAGYKYQPSMPWHPLYAHMADSANTALHLWEHHTDAHTRSRLAAAFGGDPDCARRVIAWLAGIHDLGKASPAFQRKVPSLWENLSAGAAPPSGRAHHTLTGAVATSTLQLAEAPHAPDPAAAVVADLIGAHHGLPIDQYVLDQFKRDPWWTDLLGINDHWTEARIWLARWLAARLALSYPQDIVERLHQARSTPDTAPLLSGFIILSDWIASNTEIFPPVAHPDPPDPDQYWAESEQLAKEISQRLGWNERTPLATQAPLPADQLYRRRFNIAVPHAMQRQAIHVVNTTKPGLYILESAMGDGKTETALAMAEILAHQVGLDGIVYALPTRATTSAMYDRVRQWAQNLDGSEARQVALVHGKAEYHRPQPLEVDEPGSCCVQEARGWLMGRKRRLLAPIVCCTIDHVLMAAVRQPHVLLRLWALQGKVLIIDEAHAYDAYMATILGRLLALLGQQGIPVILLSATLQPSMRSTLMAAYAGVPAPDDAPSWAPSRSYPQLSHIGVGDQHPTVHHLDPVVGRERSVHVRLLPDRTPQAAAQLVYDQVHAGGCAAVITNTVARAQDIYRLLQEMAADEKPDDAQSTLQLLLFHSRYTVQDRERIEQQVLRWLGKSGRERPHRCVVVSTQVLEQSMDVDVDFMVSDLAPVDLLLQRMGRLHRHDGRDRHGLSPQFVVTNFGLDAAGPTIPHGITTMYGKWTMLRTLDWLIRGLQPAGGCISLPDDIQTIVDCVYDDPQGFYAHSPWADQINDAYTTWSTALGQARSSAHLWAVGIPGENSTLASVAGVDKRESGVRELARVRRGYYTREYVLVSGTPQCPQWLGTADPIPPQLDRADSGRLAECVISLPAWALGLRDEDLEIGQAVPEDWYSVRPALQHARILYQDDLCPNGQYDSEIGWSRP